MASKPKAPKAKKRTAKATAGGSRKFREVSGIPVYCLFHEAVDVESLVPNPRKTTQLGCGPVNFSASTKARRIGLGRVLNGEKLTALCDSVSG